MGLRYGETTSLPLVAAISSVFASVQNGATGWRPESKAENTLWAVWQFEVQGAFGDGLWQLAVSCLPG